MGTKIDGIEIHGINGFSPEDLDREIGNGGKFVMYSYTVSVLVMTFKRPTAIYFVRGGESRLAKGLGWTGLTMLAGWWGIPWGPIYSLGSIASNLSGGTDLTRQVTGTLKRRQTQLVARKTAARRAAEPVQA